MMLELLPEIESEMNVALEIVDAPKCSAAYLEKYHVTQLPTIVVDGNGELIAQHVAIGKVSKTAVINFLKIYL